MLCCNEPLYFDTKYQLHLRRIRVHYDVIVMIISLQAFQGLTQMVIRFINGTIMLKQRCDVILTLLWRYEHVTCLLGCTIHTPEVNGPSPEAHGAMMTPSLRWRHNDHAGVSNHQPPGCLLNRLFRRKSKKTSKLRVTGLCAGNSPGTGEFSAQMASCAENVSIWWRHHDNFVNATLFLHNYAAIITSCRVRPKQNDIKITPKLLFFLHNYEVTIYLFHWGSIWQ